MDKEALKRKIGKQEELNIINRRIAEKKEEIAKMEEKLKSYLK